MERFKEITKLIEYKMGMIFPFPGKMFSVYDLWVLNPHLTYAMTQKRFNKMASIAGSVSWGEKNRKYLYLEKSDIYEILKRNVGFKETVTRRMENMDTKLEIKIGGNFFITFMLRKKQIILYSYREEGKEGKWDSLEKNEKEKILKDLRLSTKDVRVLLEFLRRIAKHMEVECVSFDKRKFKIDNNETLKNLKEGKNLSKGVRRRGEEEPPSKRKISIDQLKKIAIKAGL